MTFDINPFLENVKILELLQSVKKLIKESQNTGYDILSRGILLETVFAELIAKYNTVWTLSLVASQSPKSIMAPYLILEIQKIISNIFEAMNEMVTCIRRAYEEKEFLVYIDLLQRLGKMQYMWCYHNSLGGNAKVTNDNLEHIRSVLTFTKSLANRLSIDYEFFLLIDLGRLYGSWGKTRLCNKTLEEAMALARKLDHKGYQSAVEHVRESVERAPTIPFLLKRKDDVSKERAAITDEQEKMMIRYLLEIGGFYEDPELARLAEIGIRDRNPERILKHCLHLHTEILIYGPIWDMVALPSTGTKILYCEQKEKVVIGQELDHILARMKEETCSTCNLRSARPTEWRWTHEWQMHRDKPPKMKTIMENFLKW